MNLFNIMKFSQLAILFALFSLGTVPTQAATINCNLGNVSNISAQNSQAYLAQIPSQSPSRAEQEALLNAFMEYNKEDILIKGKVRSIMNDPIMPTVEKRRLLSELKPHRKAINRKYIEHFRPFINVEELQRLKKGLDLMAEAEFACADTDSALCSN